MVNSPIFHTFPRTIVIVGTDASGKDHVANILVSMMEETGVPVEKRGRLLSGKPTTEKDSSKKSFLDTVQEKLFLLLYQRVGVILPFMATVLIHYDLLRFKKPKGKSLVVVGHNGLRALAFHFGHKSGDLPGSMPSYLVNGLKRMRKQQGTHYIVLDVDNDVRQRRMSFREQHGDLDLFDRYMQSDGELSEQIEACLVNLCCKFLGATLIVNNDLDENELKDILLESLTTNEQKAEHCASSAG